MKIENYFKTDQCRGILSNEAIEEAEKKAGMMILLKELTIDKLRERKKAKSYMVVSNPGGELFQGKQADGTKGILIDMQSINLLITIYDNLKSKNQAKFNSVLQDEYKFANLLDKMWGWVK